MDDGTACSAREPRRRGTILERLILDTSVLVGVERTARTLDAVIGDEDDVAIAAITAAELLVGVEVADPSHRTRRSRFVEAILTTLPVEDYDLETARAHALLLAHARRAGRPRGAHDLVIAATALARQRAVVTADPDGFTDLPGVALRPFPAT